jgi:hypothetical protein
MHGQLHRENAPAMEHSTGIKVWYYHGQRHRIDGPAFESPCGFTGFYIQGKEYTEEEYWRLVKLKALW